MFLMHFNMVRKERLELSILSALASKTSVYTIPPLAHLVAEVGFEPTISWLMRPDG